MSDNKMTEISDEALMLALIDSLSTTPERDITELKAIIANEMENSILKRDYKIIFECRNEIRKCRKKLKKKEPQR